MTIKKLKKYLEDQIASAEYQLKLNQNKLIFKTAKEINENQKAIYTRICCWEEILKAL